VLALYAEELALAEPVVPWHSLRARIAELGAALDLAAGTAGKIALDVTLLAQSEVGEVRVGDPGGSSTMPHKQNPIGVVLAQACARRVHALIATLTLAHEHERAAGAWHAEWEPLSDALALTGGAAAWTRQTLESLAVNAERMRENLREETLSEARRLGDDIRAPEDYLGAADTFVDRALALFRGQTG
jgi:3-carboxy-cis,cis-muconate cycloisomerase